MTKIPGKAVRGSSTGRPIMVLLDVLGQKSTLRILWELRTDAATFRDLQERCGGVSPTLLNKRIKELKELQLVESGASGYALTQHGVELSEHLLPLNNWAEGWASEIASLLRASQ